MNQTQAKTLSEDLAAGRKTFDGWRRELGYSAAARQRVSDIFQQQHGFPPTQQDLDYASGRLGSGWSLQDYRRNEALSERTAAQLRDLIPAVQGRSYLEADAGWIKSQQDRLGDGQESMQRVREDLAHSSSVSDAIQESYRNFGDITPSLSTIHEWQDYLAGVGTQASMNASIINAHGPDAIRHAYRDWGGIEPNGDQVSVFMDHLHRGGTVQGMRDPIINVHGPDAIRNIYRNTGGIEPSAKQVDDFVDYLHRGGTVQGARIPIAQVDGGNTANRYANSILGHDLSAEQRAQYVDRLTHGATQAEVRHDIAYSAEATRAVGNIYNAALGRNPDPGGLKTQLERLADNKSLSDLRREIAFSQEATNRLTQQTSDLIRKAGIEQGVVWSGVPEALTSLQGNIAAGQATMGQVQTAIERCMFATCFPGSTVTPASVLREFSAVAVRGVAPAAEGMGAAAMAESAGAIIGEIVAGTVATPAAIAASVFWPQPTNQFYDERGNAISETAWVQRENLRQNVIAQINEDKTLVWTGNLGGGADPNDKLQVHHCVPIKLEDALPARNILEKWQIGINDPANASIIPRSFHFSEEIHGGQGAQKGYGDLISQYMGEADRLAKIESQSSGGGDAGFKAGRAVVMESLRRFCDNLTYKSKDPNAIVFQEIMRNVEKGVRKIVNGNQP